MPSRLGRGLSGLARHPSSCVPRWGCWWVGYHEPRCPIAWTRPCASSRDADLHVAVSDAVCGTVAEPSSEPPRPTPRSSDGRKTPNRTAPLESHMGPVVGNRRRSTTSRRRSPPPTRKRWTPWTRHRAVNQASSSSEPSPVYTYVVSLCNDTGCADRRGATVLDDGATDSTGPDTTDPV